MSHSIRIFYISKLQQFNGSHDITKNRLKKKNQHIIQAEKFLAQPTYQNVSNFFPILGWTEDFSEPLVYCLQLNSPSVYNNRLMTIGEIHNKKLCRCINEADNCLNLIVLTSDELYRFTF